MAQPPISAKFAAFSDPTRLRILHVLRDGERCVGDLVTILRLPQPSVSRHLAYLRRSGLVTTRENGLWMFYNLTAASSPAHQKLIECDVRRARQLRKVGGCCPIPR